MHASPFRTASFPHALHRNRRARGSRGFSLIEVLVALTIFGLVMAAVAQQMIEGLRLSVKTARTLEFTRNGRQLIDRMNHDLSNAQAVLVYPEFDDREDSVSISGYGNYVVMHQIDITGTITRTIGYYLVPNQAGDTFALRRHDSTDGSLEPGVLPVVSSGDSHALIVRNVRLPAAEDVKLFRNWKGNGFTLRGQFGTPNGPNRERLEYVQCSLTSRS